MTQTEDFESKLHNALNELGEAMAMVQSNAKDSPNKKTVDAWLRLRHAKDEIRWVGSFLVNYLTDPQLFTKEDNKRY